LIPLFSAIHGIVLLVMMQKTAVSKKGNITPIGSFSQCRKMGK
jgi:hypothetical protein